MSEPLSRAIADCAYSIPTPVQASALPPQLAGRDLMAMAETGTGKTAAFLLPILQAQALRPAQPGPREAMTLILAPTRELALQIDAEAGKLARHLPVRRAVVLGGVGKGPQIQALRRGVHILVATPGRLLDLANERHVDLSRVSTLILDEADRMFDMGFIRDIRRIVALVSKERRTALFSATMPDEIRRLAKDLLRDPASVNLSPKQVVVDRIAQSVMFVRTVEKQSRLHTLLKDEACSRVIVFTRTKRGADRVASRLAMAGIGAAAIHGNKAQNARQRALRDFSAGHVRVLVATDIAARGIDVSDITHVVNFDMPVEPETYVHRIGRTARKGTSGIAISLCDTSERAEVAAIERLMKQRIDVVADIGGDVSALPPTRPHHTPADPGREYPHRHHGHRGGGKHSAGNGRNRANADRGRNGEPGEKVHRDSGHRAQPAEANRNRQHNGKPQNGIAIQPRAAAPFAAKDKRHAPQPGATEHRRARPAPEGAGSETKNHRDNSNGSRGRSWDGQRPPKFLNGQNSRKRPRAAS